MNHYSTFKYSRKCGTSTASIYSFVYLRCSYFVPEIYLLKIYYRFFDNNSPGFTSVYTQIQPGNGGRIATPSTNLNDYQTVDIITSRTHQMRLQKADTNFDSERGDNDTILRPQTYPAQHLHM